MLYFHW